VRAAVNDLDGTMQVSRRPRGLTAAPHARLEQQSWALLSLHPTAWIIVAQGLTVLLTLARYGILCRQLATVDSFGEFGMARSFTLIFSFLGDLGIRMVLVSQMAAEPTRALTGYRTAQSLRILISVASLPLLAAIAAFAGSGSDRLAMLVAGLVALTQTNSDTAAAALLGHQRLRLSAVVILLDGALGTAGVWIAMSIEPTVLSAYVGMLTGNIVRMLVTLALARATVLPTILPGWSTAAARDLLIRALPVGTSLTLFALYGRIGVFVLAWKGASLWEIGLLTTAVTITSLLVFVPATCSTWVLPTFSSLHASRREEARQFHERTLSLLVLSGLFAAAALVAVADPMLRLLLGARFSAAAPAVIVMAASLPLGFMSFVYKCMLVPLRREKADLAAVLAGIAIQAAAAWVLCGRYGALGAATAYLVAEVAVFFVKHLLVVSIIGPVSAVHHLLKPAVCGAGVYAAGYLLRQCDIPWMLRSVGVFATLVCLVIATRAIRVELLPPLLRKYADPAGEPARGGIF
jgi:O-antigen/teichoic acid export membrane protein